MNQKQLLRFMKKAIKDNSPEIVYSKNGKEYTLKEVRNYLPAQLAKVIIFLHFYFVSMPLGGEAIQNRRKRV